ncbi:hypothetical protein QFC22_000223 [Naganishia vaughanmartiniae]|uniref:Uncharacterized protein n=1 Tax=Naganishia vaughanmartiniae TaxID=1424756 RepID=A0ACC2XNR1_9TREE|nr:hypothetical protein QFC22_000223 [Naganishia vaughanmartiniae]
MQRLEQSYPDDVASFERSFPPLCEKCAPKVEDVIKKKDYAAQINAWKMILQDAGKVSARVPKRALARLLVDVRASAKATQLRLVRQNNHNRRSTSVEHRFKSNDMSGRPQGPNDPFNLISLINNVSSPNGRQIPSAHDPDQPRNSPMIQLSPSPEIEPLPMSNLLPVLDHSANPDSMDWEATGTSICSSTDLGGSPRQSTLAKSAWDRFATTKQRIFVKDQLTGLERAFETWRDLGVNTNPETTRHLATTATASKRVYTHRRSAARAAYMLASVLRILSLALTWPTRARELSVEPERGRGSGTGFGIAASVLEAVVASPHIASSQIWGLQQLPSSTSFNPALPSSGIDTVKPLSQELSRLTYYAANKPGKLRAIGEELDERVAKHTRYAKSGNGKERVMLLISLAILRSLISECRRELGLFALSIVNCIDRSLEYALSPNSSGSSGTSSTVGVDLELAVAAGAAFTSFTTYATSSTFGADDAALRTYLRVLERLAAMAVFQPRITGTVGLDQKRTDRVDDKSTENGDFEFRNRTRLIGLAAMIAAVQSSLLNASYSDFGTQARIFIPALITNIWLANLDELKLETAKVQIDTSPSPYFTEFQARRRLSGRRAPSLHAHIVGEKGPATSEVVGGALMTLRELIESCHSSQLTTCLQAIMDVLDRSSSTAHTASGSVISGWKDRERCCWLVECVASDAMLGYRYIVPLSLLEQLVAGTKDTAALGERELTLMEALISLFSAEKLSLVGIAPAELLNSLLDIIIARVRMNTSDILLPSLVRCILAIGSHIYYVDQTNDMIEVVINRIAETQALTKPLDNSDPSGTAKTSLPWCQEAIRIMIACMTNLIMASQPSSGTTIVPSSRENNENRPLTDLAAGGNPSSSHVTTPNVNGGASALPERSGRRNPISPEIWQDTLPLLCEATYGVRAEYARALVLYLRRELPASVRVLTNGRGSEHGIHLKQARLGAIRFLHAMNATLYTLAISNRLGYAGPAQLSAPAIAPTIQETAPTPFFESPQAATPNTAKSIDTPARAVPTPQPPNHSSNSSVQEDRRPPPPLIARRSSKLVSLPVHRMAGVAFGEETITEHALVDDMDKAGDVATPGDYLALSSIIDITLDALPIESGIIVIPMLIAIDNDAGRILVPRPNENDEDDEYFSMQRRRACKEVVCSAWQGIASHYAISELLNTVDQIQASFTRPSVVPAGPFREAREGLFPPDQPSQFAAIHVPTPSRPVINPEYAIQQLALNRRFQSDVKLPSEEIVQVLSRPWTVQEALGDSIIKTVNEASMLEIFAML